MASTRLSADMVLTGAVASLMAFGVITPTESVSGFANPAVMAIAALYVVARAIRETGAVDLVVRWVLGSPRHLWSAQARLMTAVSGASAFMNNTPVVAMMVPTVMEWSRRTGLMASKLLIPLSYAAILGGTTTLIGTSTNLVVVAMAEEQLTGVTFGMFDLTFLGLPAAVAAVSALVFFSKWLLPERGGSRARLAQRREYTVALRVEKGSPVVDRSIESAGLRQLPGLYLVEVERDGHSMVAVGPHVVLRANDVLVFAGVVESVVDLRRIKGLVPATDQVNKLMEPSRLRRLVEVAISARSALVGKSIRESRFRTSYNAAVVAVHRRGERIRQKVGDIVLQAGDALLLETHPSFVGQHRNDDNFALVSEVEGSDPVRHERSWWATTVLLLLVVTLSFQWLPLYATALGAAALMVATGCLTPQQARRSVDWGVVVTVAMAFAIGVAITKTGLGTEAARLLVAASGPLGPWGLMFTLFILAAVLTSLASNNACAALAFPIVVEVSQLTGLDMKTALLLLMMGASASFATPVGYQTNLMVLGPGGYRFVDFLRAGIPITLIVGLVTVTLISLTLPQ